jgi:hypothetical protein
MANSNGWGDGASNNDIGWGKGADNAIGWGSIYADSWAGATDIVGTPAPSLLLDTYTNAAVAYSLRKLRTAYTGSAIRVRRSVDNAEQNIGFVDNVLDTASLLTFCGAGNGFVTTWYDQSGNANNAINSTAIAQPQIVSSGAMILINGKPSVQFDGSNDQLNLGSVITAGASSFNSFVAKRAASGDNFWALSEKDATGYLLGSISNTYYYQPKTTQYQASSATDTTTNQLLITGQNNAGTMSIFKNGSTITSTASNLTYSPTIDSVGRYSGLFSKCNIQETIFYNTNQSTNRTGIESNINTFYTIY